MKDKRDTTQKWKVRKDGDTRRTPEILHIGQQTLKIVVGDKY